MAKTYVKTNKIPIENIVSDINESVVIIVPYRNDIFNERKEQLEKFVDYYHDYLPNCKILIVEQSDDGKKFNRGALLNIGFKISQLYKFKRYVIHDVDLISPKSIRYLYTYNSKNPFHIGWLWKDKYNYWSFFSGVVSFDKKTFIKINGFPNTFWGWGGEDTATYNRLKINNFEIYRPETQDNKYFIYEMKHTPETINVKKGQNIAQDLKNWKNDGLKQVQFDILEANNYKYDNVIRVMVDIYN